MIDFDPMDDESQKELFELLTKHLNYTGSVIAKHILDNWSAELAQFVKIMPRALKEALEPQGRLKQAS